MRADARSARAASFAVDLSLHPMLVCVVLVSELHAAHDNGLRISKPAAAGAAITRAAMPAPREQNFVDGPHQIVAHLVPLAV